MAWLLSGDDTLCTVLCWTTGAGHRSAVLTLGRLSTLAHTLLIDRHGIGLEPACTRDWIETWLPLAEIVLGIVENLSSMEPLLKSWANIAGYDGSVVEKVEKTTAMTCEEGLLLGPLDDGGEVEIVCFFELPTGLGSRTYQ